MIATRNTGVERVSSLQGEKVAMSIDTSSAAMAHIMKSMIDLYTDQEKACIREYSTNAWDAHVMAGNTARPIEVELPGPLSPFFTVRDFGVGLSVDDIFEIYSKYGASTKRDSNDVQGMLGYGCKAALSYTPQFTVTSVKDGVRAQIAVSREGDGGGSMQIVDTTATTEPNNTLIQIPVRRENDFERKARMFFSVWEDGTVLVNGKAPEKVQGLPVGDNMTVIDAGMDVYNRRANAQSYVVMGKVAYPATFPGLDLSHGFGLVVRVPIGAVNFTPSREGLMEQDPTTRQTLSRVTSEFASLAPGAIQTQIDAADTAHEALNTMLRFRQMIPAASRTNYVHQGRPLPASFRFDGATDTVATRRSSAMSTCNALWEYDAAQWPRTLWMEGHDGTKYTPTHKRKTLQWCDSNGKQELTTFVHLKGRVPADVRRYIDPSNIIKWQQVKDEKLPTVRSLGTWSGGRTKAITGSFDVWIDGDWQGEVAASAFDSSKPMFYRHGNRAMNRAYASLVHVLEPSHTFVCVPGNRLDKFRRDFPNAREAAQEAGRAFGVWKAALDKDTLTAMAMDDTCQRVFFTGLDILRVNDPDLKRAIRLAKIDLTNVAKQRKVFQAVRLEANLVLPHFDNPLTKYPLVARQYGRYNELRATEADHFYIYVNAAYAASKNGA